MSISTDAYRHGRSVGLARLRDYVDLMRPKIALLSLGTVAAGAVLGSWAMSPMSDPLVLVHAFLAAGLLACSASALNQYLERHGDAKMPRTADRPLPAGRLSRQEVLVFGIVTGVTAIVWFTVAVDPRTALIGGTTWILYVCIYTPLKSRTTLNTAIGAIAGALPIWIGWSAGGGAFGIEIAALLVMVYLWQFPHFMAIAWLYRHDYKAADLKMATVVDYSGESAGWQALVASIALLAVSVAPCMWLLGGGVYLLGAVIFGLLYVTASARFLYLRNDDHARRLLRVSLVYLPSVLGLLIMSGL